MVSSGYSPNAVTPSVPPWATRAGTAAAACPSCTDGPLELWIDPVNGDDANDGLTQLTPVQTLMRIDALIPLIVEHPVTVHAREGDAVLDRPYVYRNRSVIGDGSILTYADEVWSAAVFTTVTSGVAQAGTADDAVVTLALPGVAAGMWLEMTSGVAVGQRRTIRNLNVLTLVPCEAFGVVSGDVPAPGDNWRVFTPAFRIVAPFEEIELVQSDHGSSRSVTGTWPDYVEPLWIFRGIGLRPEWRVNTGGRIRCEGVYQDSSAFASDVGIARSTCWQVGTDTTFDSDARQGWGWTLAGAGFKRFQSVVGDRDGGVDIEGYFVGSGFFLGFGAAHLVGGGFTASVGAYASARLSVVANWGIVPVRIGGEIFAGDDDLGQPDGVVVAEDIDFVAGFASPRVVVRGGTCRLNSSNVVGESTVGPSVLVQPVGGKLILSGDPVALGRAAALDWDVGDGAPVNRAYYAAVGAIQQYNTGSIQRVL